MADTAFNNCNINITENLISYSIKSVAKIIGLVDYEQNIANGNISIICKNFEIRFIKPLLSTINDIIFSDLNPKFIPSAIGNYEIPLLTNEDSITIFSTSKNSITLNFDILSVAIVMLARLEETATENLDVYGRFGFEDSLAKKYDFVHIPLLDEYCFLLKKEIEKQTDISLIKRITKIIPSHDIDFIHIKDHPAYFFKSNIKRLFKDKDIVEFIKIKFLLLQSLLFTKKDVCLQAIENLMEDSKKFNLKSEFYFMTAEKSLHDTGYDSADKILKKIYTKILKNKMFIGLHAGFTTYLDENEFQKQKSILEKSAETEIIINRQHYLKIKIPQTIHIFRNSGISVDSTLGFAEHEGFRCGTCIPYNFFDLQLDRETNVEILPLVVMDVTLLDYRKKTNLQSFDILQKLYQTTKLIGGDFTILIHNSTVVTHRNWYKNVYLKFLDLNTKTI